MSEKKYPYPKAKGVHIPNMKWLADLWHNQLWEHWKQERERRNNEAERKEKLRG